MTHLASSRSWDPVPTTGAERRLPPRLRRRRVLLVPPSPHPEVSHTAS